MLFEFWTAWDFLKAYWPWLLGGTVGLLLAFGYAYLTGRILVAIEALGGLVVALVAGQIFRRGAASEKARQDAANQNTIDRTREAQSEVDRMSDAEVQARLDQWIPPKQ